MALGAAPAENVRWADLTGDHKVGAAHCAPWSCLRFADLKIDIQADYLVIGDDNGSIHLYENVGVNHDSKDSPQAIGGYAAGVRLADYNGDGRDDYLSVDQNSAVLEFNNGGPAPAGGSEPWLWTNVSS